MEKKIEQNNFKKFDIVQLNDEKFIIYRLSKEKVELLPISNLLTSGEKDKLIPRLITQRKFLENYELIDSNEIFYLLNQNNSLIREVIDYHLKP